jgi:hypothetical protein
MSVLIEDSPRNLAGWITESVSNGYARGAVITPWATPYVQHSGAGKKPSATNRIAELQSNGVDVAFDPMTHVLQMSGVGDLRFYQEYDLWAGPQGDLTDQALIEGHVDKVFRLQDSLDVVHCAPTVLLHSGLEMASTIALDTAREAIRRDPNTVLTIAGTKPFWASGAALDAHIGAMASLSPSAWVLTVVRTETELPVTVDAEEVHGLCRTSRALSEDARVHISHGDLAGLPAVAAGASTVGTGWDQRQRVCAYGHYGPRDADAGGGGWYQRPTLRGLLGSITSDEGIVLNARNPQLVTRLGGLPAPGPREAFDHHIATLGALVDAIAAESDWEDKYRLLAGMYNAARAEWQLVRQEINPSHGSRHWIDGLAAGLDLYARTEGFI